jgi:hypothetical protein
MRPCRSHSAIGNVGAPQDVMEAVTVMTTLPGRLALRAHEQSSD